MFRYSPKWKVWLLWISIGALVSLTSLFLVYQAQSSTAAEISLNPGTRYQTISGWEATDQSGHIACGSFPKYRNELFDRAVNELGINRIRLELYSVTENSTDYFAQYLNQQISNDVWRQHRHESINDNGNPNQASTGGFHFSMVDHSVDNVILPLKQRIEANGEKLYINLNFVDFNATHPFEHKNNAGEYAELILVVFQHLQAKYGWVPDGVEIILEPDTNASWTGTQVGQAIAATGNRLAAAGFHPDIIAPSTTSMSNASLFVDQIAAVPGALDYLSMISYHRYSGVSDSALQDIAKRAQQHGLQTGMLEHIGSDYQNLHQDLKVGGNSAWQQFTLGFCTGDDGAQYYWIDQSDPNNPKVNLGSRSGFLRQYFRWVRRGAVRIGATTSSASFDPLPFINPDGGYTVVVKAESGGAIHVANLPAGTYRIRYTTFSAFDQAQPDVTVQAGQTLQTSIPEKGVLTIYRLKASTPPQFDHHIYLPLLQRME